jgi:hypothetical protein
MERIAFVGGKFQIPKKPLNDPAPWPPSPPEILRGDEMLDADARFTRLLMMEDN